MVTNNEQLKELILQRIREKQRIAEEAWWEVVVFQSMIKDINEGKEIDIDKDYPKYLQQMKENRGEGLLFLTGISDHDLLLDFSRRLNQQQIGITIQDCTNHKMTELTIGELDEKQYFKKGAKGIQLDIRKVLAGDNVVDLEEKIRKMMEDMKQHPSKLNKTNKEVKVKVGNEEFVLKYKPDEQLKCSECGKLGKDAKMEMWGLAIVCKNCYNKKKNN